jgi:hypothetical protein
MARHIDIWVCQGKVIPNQYSDIVVGPQTLPLQRTEREETEPSKNRHLDIKIESSETDQCIQ